MRVDLDHVELARISPAPRLRRRRRLPVATAVLTALGIAWAVGLAGAKPPSAPLAAPSANAAPAWIDIEHPIQLYALNAPELDAVPLYEARRNSAGGGRQDILTFGELDGDRPFLRLMLYRVGSERQEETPFFVDVARLAASASLAVTRSLDPQDLATRFGDFEAADIDVAPGSGAPTPCLGFRGSMLDGGFRISGLACGTEAKPMSRPALACMLDRLDFESGGDPSLADFFALTELRRDPFCAGTGLAPMPLKASWIDQADAPPPLRLRKMR